MSKSPTKAKKGMSHLRPCVPLRFSAKQAEIVLHEICPHRKKFTCCQRYFCTVAFEKYQWLELVREKSKEAQSIVQEADQLLRNKLLHCYNNSIDNLLLNHENELEIMRRQLLQRSSKHKLIDENLRYVKFYELDKKDPLEVDCPLGYTKEHVDFIIHQHQVLTERKQMHIKTALDHKRFEQSQELEKLKQSIDSPISFLDHLLGNHLETIRFHTGRIEKIILYILNLCVLPRTFSPNPPDVDDPLVVCRVKKASSQAFQLLKTTLNALANLCGDIRKIYCNAEEEISMFLLKSPGKNESSGKIVFPIPISKATEVAESNEPEIAVEKKFGVAGESYHSVDVEVDGGKQPLTDCENPHEVPFQQHFVIHKTAPQRNKVRRKVPVENKLIARMSDTKLNDKALLTSNISRAQENFQGRVKSIDDIEDKTAPWNPKPCCFCGKHFRGSGKLSPSITNKDADTRSRAKRTIKQDRSCISYVNKKVDISEKFGEKKKALLFDLEQSTDHASNSMVVFCSWVCVKRWTVTCCPMQYKYQSEMLIDMVAGYSVKI